jgi:hypothetical protein
MFHEPLARDTSRPLVQGDTDWGPGRHRGNQPQRDMEKTLEFSLARSLGADFCPVLESRLVALN